MVYSRLKTHCRKSGYASIRRPCVKRPPQTARLYKVHADSALDQARQPLELDFVQGFSYFYLYNFETQTNRNKIKAIYRRALMKYWYLTNQQKTVYRHRK